MIGPNEWYRDEESFVQELDTLRQAARLVQSSLQEDISFFVAVRVGSEKWPRPVKALAKCISVLKDYAVGEVSVGDHHFRTVLHRKVKSSFCSSFLKKDEWMDPVIFIAYLESLIERHNAQPYRRKNDLVWFFSRLADLTNKSYYYYQRKRRRRKTV